MRKKKIRLKFAKDHQNTDFPFWNIVLFTDESEFNVFGSYGKPIVWRFRNQELRLNSLKPTVKIECGSVMVRGNFSQKDQDLCILLMGLWIKMSISTF